MRTDPLIFGCSAFFRNANNLFGWITGMLHAINTNVKFCLLSQSANILSMLLYHLRPFTLAGYFRFASQLWVVQIEHISRETGQKPLFEKFRVSKTRRMFCLAIHLFNNITRKYQKTLLTILLNSNKILFRSNLVLFQSRLSSSTNCYFL